MNIIIKENDELCILKDLWQESKVFSTSQYEEYEREWQISLIKYVARKQGVLYISATTVNSTSIKENGKSRIVKYETNRNSISLTVLTYD